jgi:hypothetical protein
MPEPTLPEKRLKGILLTKVYSGNEDQLNADIKEKRMSAGATSDLSAIKKLVREKGDRKLDGVASIQGRFLQLYHRRPRQRDSGQESEERGYSTYLMTAEGVQTVHFTDHKNVPDPRTLGLSMSVGEPQLWSNLEQHESVITGAKWLVAPKGTKLAPVDKAQAGKNLWDMSRPITRITDGLGLWNGHISGVFEVAVFDEEGNRTDELKQILGDGGEANLSVGITDDLDQKTGRVGKAVANVKIKTVPQLETLLGDSYNESALMSENAVAELRDALNGTPVVVFGSGLTRNNPRLNDTQKAKMKRSTVNLTGGLGLISPYEPSQALAAE